MNSISIDGVARPYRCIVGSGVSKYLPQAVKNLTKAKTVLVVTDDNVNALYGEKICSLIKDSGLNCLKFVFRNGEENKNLKTVSDILEFAAENGISRSDCIVALGGGIVGDTAGFCAATMLRGIDFIQMPTTFLSAIDSSVGGKTGVNLKAGKNLAGAFYQPRAVLCDTDFLSTLTPDIFADGTAEAIKYGVIFDKKLFDTLCDDFTPQIEEVISRCIELKGEVVKRDEHDTGERQLLNFGHTIGHSIEICSDFQISHGKAVAIGMVMAAKAAYKNGISDKDWSTEIKNALIKNKLPFETDLKICDLLSVMLHDKKITSSGITLVLPQTLGHCVLHKIQTKDLEKFISA